MLDALFADSADHGGAAMIGRVEAGLLPALAHRGCFFRYSPRSLVYTQNTEPLGTIASGQALLTRLEGDWWMST